jgi:PKD repeat protein
VQTFDASTSLPGWNGTAYIAPTEYQYNFGDGSSIINTTASSWTHTYTLAGTYTATVTVWAWDNIKYNMSDTSTQTAIVFVRPVGCSIDLTSQDWRYIDPTTIPTTDVGLGSEEPCDAFRPGDLVQLFATVTYNGAPVSNQLVTFQVFDNKKNNVLTATALSNCNGTAEWDFRIPWPSTNNIVVNNLTQGSFVPFWNTSEFGIWHAVATWQCGSQQSEQPPFEKTQNDTMSWTVSWGLTIIDVTVSPLTAVRGPATCGYGDTVTIKVNVENDYAEAIPGLLTGTILDNLLVPIYPPAVWSGTFTNCSGTINTETLSGVPIPSYAYVGTAYAWVNLLTTWPSLAGTAFCPPVCVEFSISVHP